MFLKQLHMVNFRIHKDSLLKFGKSPMVLIVGSNWSGKSTIGQAISMCLTPTTTGLDPAGREFISKIRTGESKAVITAHLQTKHHLIERTVTLNTNTSGRTRQSTSLTDPKWNTTPFDRKLDEQRTALMVALNSDAFLRMDEKQQRNLLASLALPSRYSFDPVIVRQVKSALGETGINFEAEPFEAINRAYKGLFDERQIANRQVREFLMPDAVPMPEGANSASLQERLTALRSERKSKQDQRNAAVEAATDVEINRDRFKRKQASLLTDEKLESLRAVAATKPEQVALTKEKKKAESRIDEVQRQLNRLERAPNAGADCPTCGQFIDPLTMKALTDALSESLRVAHAEQLAAHQKIRALGDVEDAVKQVAAHEATLKELAEAENPAQPMLFDFGPFDRSIAELDVEIEAATAQLRPAILAEERQKEIAIRREQLVGLRERAMSLDVLVKYFDKDGIKAKLLTEYIGGFETKLNEVMSAWNYGCSLTIEPYSFEVTNARGNKIPVRELSGAERVMFSLAFQCAVSRTANLGIVVIDEVAMFLPELRPVLYMRLEEMIREGYLEQVILLVADTSPAAVGLHDALVFKVEDGKVTQCERLLRKADTPFRDDAVSAEDALDRQTA